MLPLIYLYLNGALHIIIIVFCLPIWFSRFQCLKEFFSKLTLVWLVLSQFNICNWRLRNIVFSCCDERDMPFQSAGFIEITLYFNVSNCCIKFFVSPMSWESVLFIYSSEWWIKIAYFSILFPELSIIVLEISVGKLVPDATFLIADRLAAVVSPMKKIN